MQHRNYSKAKTCQSCRFWSEMVARSGSFGVEALCLSITSESRNKYTPGSHTCTAWKSGHLGAIDEPGNEQDTYDGGPDGDPSYGYA